MGQLEESWNDVGEQFKKLGARLKQHYDEQGFDEAVEASEESLEEAMQRLGDGLRAAVGAVGDSVNDPELKDDVRDTAGSLFTALGATFSELGAQIAVSHEDGEHDSAAAEDVDPEAASESSAGPDAGDPDDNEPEVEAP